MIRVRREAPEPSSLGAARAEKLPEIERKLESGEKLLDDDFVGYGAPEVKDVLYEMHHRKCCYCEKRVEKENEDVEHFRPKRKANRVPGSKARSGYWWLTFSWDNLLFSCRQCNTKKGFKFPLRIGSGVLSAPPPSGAAIAQMSEIEWPILIHPSREQGILHIQFCEERFGDRRSWRPRPRAGSVKGAFTIRHLRLDREALIEEYERHVRRFVEPLLDKVKQALEQGDKEALWKAFYKARANIFAQEEPFLGLAYDVVRALVPDEDLAKVDARHRWPAPDEVPIAPRSSRRPGK